jgi:hypothetical protein
MPPVTVVSPGEVCHGRAALRVKKGQGQGRSEVAQWREFWLSKMSR